MEKATPKKTTTDPIHLHRINGGAYCRACHVICTVMSAMLNLSTDAMDNAGTMDYRYTADGDNSSPELHWTDVPAQCKCFALIVDDPDAHRAVFTHWVVYDIPRSISHLPAGIPPQDTLPNGIRQGLNSSFKLGYMGPNPPLGDPPHRYRFRLFALRDKLALPPRATSDVVLRAIQDLVVEVAEITGSYQRPLRRAG